MNLLKCHSASLWGNPIQLFFNGNFGGEDSHETMEPIYEACVEELTCCLVCDRPSAVKVKLQTIFVCVNMHKEGMTLQRLVMTILQMKCLLTINVVVFLGPAVLKCKDYLEFQRYLLSTLKGMCFYRKQET